MVWRSSCWPTSMDGWRESDAPQFHSHFGTHIWRFSTKILYVHDVWKLLLLIIFCPLVSMYTQLWLKVNFQLLYSCSIFFLPSENRPRYVREFDWSSKYILIESFDWLCEHDNLHLIGTPYTFVAAISCCAIVSLEIGSIGWYQCWATGDLWGILFAPFLRGVFRDFVANFQVSSQEYKNATAIMGE